MSVVACAARAGVAKPCPAPMNKPDDFDCWRLPDDDSVQKCVSPPCAGAHRVGLFIFFCATCPGMYFLTPFLSTTCFA